MTGDGMSMYERVMGPGFDRLHTALQRFHRLAGQHALSGWVETVAPVNFVAKLLAMCLGTPMRSVQGPIRFELDAAPAREVWIRFFPDKTMRSRFRAREQRIIEQLGPARLTFSLHEQGGMLVMRLVRMHFLGIRCPPWLMPHVVAEETGGHDRVEFKVSARVPLAGFVVGYHGHLNLASEAGA